MKLFFSSEKYSEVLVCMQQVQPHLDLLWVHNIDRQIEGPQHHIAVAIAVMWCTLGGGMAAAACVLCPTSGNTRAPRSGHVGLRWGSLHQMDYFPIYI